MHSSRMRTARSLTIVGGRGYLLGMYLPGGACPGGGVPAQGGTCPGTGGTYPGGCLPREVSAWGHHVTYPIVHLMIPVCCLHTN